MLFLGIIFGAQNFGGLFGKIKCLGKEIFYEKLKIYLNIAKSFLRNPSAMLKVILFFFLILF
jgi:hypothetical protein